MEGKILQRAELFLVQKGKARHIRHWKDLLAICQEKGIKPDCHSWTYKDGHEFPPKGKDIENWPEENSNHKVGPERIMFCVGPNDDFAKIAKLGVTVIQTYELPFINTLAYLDKAQANKLRVLYSIADRIHNEILAHGDWDRNEVHDIIEKCKGHPGLYCWHVFDEANLHNREITHHVQRDVYEFFKNRDPNHAVIQSLAGGTKEWSVINFDALDWFIASTYVYNGTGKIWGMEPLAYLEVVAQEEREYLDKHNIEKEIAFIFQCCDEPAVLPNTKVPLGHIQEQFDVLREYGLFTRGVALWAWNHGYFGPATSNEMYNEIKDLFDKIKER